MFKSHYRCVNGFLCCLCWCGALCYHCCDLLMWCPTSTIFTLDDILCRPALTAQFQRIFLSSSSFALLCFGSFRYDGVVKPRVQVFKDQNDKLIKLGNFYYALLQCHSESPGSRRWQFTECITRKCHHFSSLGYQSVHLCVSLVHGCPFFAMGNVFLVRYVSFCWVLCIVINLISMTKRGLSHSHPLLAHLFFFRRECCQVCGKEKFCT